MEEYENKEITEKFMSFEAPKLEENTIQENPEQKEEEFKLSPENREIILDIINHPVIKKGLTNYEIFSQYYLEGIEKSKKEELMRKGEKLPTKEQIKERADFVFITETKEGREEDPFYKNILELNRSLNKEDFIKPIVGEIKRFPNSKFEELIEELKLAKEKGNFYEVVTEKFIDKQINKQIDKLREEGKEKGIMIKRIKKMYVEVINNECRPHLTQVAEDWKSTFPSMKDSFKVLANLLETDEDFKNVEKIEMVSWLFGKEEIAKSFDETFEWNRYSEKWIEEFEKENPEIYKNLQKTGIKISPRLFKNYLLTETLPRVEGRWIEKGRFIERIKKI